MALAARRIVVLIGGFFNRPGRDVGVRPLVQLMPVEGNALFSDRKFPNVGPDGLVELVPAHAQVARGIAEANEPRLNAGGLGRCGVCHGYAPSALWRQKGLFGGFGDRGFESRGQGCVDLGLRGAVVGALGAVQGFVAA